MLSLYARRVCLLAMLLVVVVGCGGPEAPLEWPAWRGSQGDGISSETGLLSDWTHDQPKESWRVPLGLGFSAIAVSNGVLYTEVGEEDEGAEYCVALSGETGEEIWRHRIGDLYKSAIGDGPRATPAVNSGKVYAVSAHGDLWCLDVIDGRPLWNLDLYERFPAERPLYGVSSSPVIYRDLLLYNVGGRDGSSLVALDKDSGELRWASADDAPGYSTAIVARIADRTQAIFFTGEGAVGVSPDKGTVLWRYDWETFGNANAATPVVGQDHVFISSGYGAGAALIQISQEGRRYTAAKVWENPQIQNQYSSAILWQGYLYGFSGGVLTCVDFESGEIVWRKRGFQHGSLLAVNAGYMLVLGYRCSLALVELAPQGYREHGRVQAFSEDARCLTVPSVANGELFIRNESEIVAFDLRPTESTS
jgi:outer membrane protein assembly factor BamB